MKLMDNRKRELLISAMLVIYLVVFFVLGSAHIITNSLGTAVFNTSIYFAVCYLYINLITSTKWRIVMVASSLCLIAVIISVRFYQRPHRWSFASRIIYGIDTIAMVAFLQITFTRDLRSTVLFALFVAEVILVVQNREDSAQLYQIFTLVVSIIIYIMLCTFHIMQIWAKRWKAAAVAAIFITSLVLGILFRIYWDKKKMLFVLIASINGCLSIVPWMWLTFAPTIKTWWQQYREEEMIQDENYNFLEMAGLPTRFTLQELETATENFKEPIGEGASGTVFKGTLPDGSIIAVKRIKWQPSGETEFQTEMTVIASRQHVNLVRILGFCLTPRRERYLIYPFLENGSLDSWLFTDDNKRCHLTWVLRYCIAVDVAKALAYLHHECHQQILHLDIKPANILLDGDFRALLSDFGISKLIGKDESSVMTKARGTVGYLAPEMLVPNAISTKSDIYSYGMVLLELISGRKNLTMVMDGETGQRRSSYFPKIAREKMMQGEIMEVVDKCLIVNEDIIREEEVTVLTRLALWCIQENPTLRPSTIEVVDVLEGRKTVDVPPESSMFVVNILDGESECSSSQHRDDNTALMSVNNLSISIQSGR